MNICGMKGHTTLYLTCEGAIWGTVQTLIGAVGVIKSGISCDLGSAGGVDSAGSYPRQSRFVV